MFGIPGGLPSDRGPHFLAEITRGIAGLLQMKWDSHTMETAVEGSGRKKEPNIKKADWKIASRKTFETGGNSPFGIAEN